MCERNKFSIKKAFCGEKKKKMFAVALDPIQQKLGAECPFPAKMVDWAQNKVVINNTNIINIIIMKIST